MPWNSLGLLPRIGMLTHVPKIGDDNAMSRQGFSAIADVLSRFTSPLSSWHGPLSGKCYVLPSFVLQLFNFNLNLTSL